MPRPLLIIGGSYFAGKTLVTHLAENPDYALYVVNRGNRPLHLPGVTELVADRTDPEALRQVLPALSWAAVIDFCGYTAEEITCLESETTRDSAYNLAAPELISYPRYIEVLEEITGKRPPVMTMKISAINDRRLPLPFPLDSHIIVSSEKLIRDTGFCYTSFTEGMRHTWQWYRQQKEQPT